MTVCDWLAFVRNGGFDALRARSSPGPPPKLTASQKRSIPELLWHGPEAYDYRGLVWTCARIARVIEEEFGVRYHKGHVGRILKGLGWTPQKPIKLAVQRDEETMVRWRVETWPELRRKAQRECRALIFEDESGFHLLPGILKTYAPEGLTPILREKQTRDHLSVMGAMTPWGRVEHRVIARFAEPRLTPKSKAAVEALLEPSESLADASTWADENRRKLPQTGTRHYVDVPLDEPKYDAKFSGDTSSKGCFVDKIHEMTATLKDPSKSVENRRFALRFLVHLVEDLHMPLHVGDDKDKGGNTTQVQLLGKGSNMHRLWDSDMIESGGATEDSWLAKLSEDQDQEAAAGSVEDWATQSLLLALAAYKAPGSDERIKSGRKLGDDYLEANLLVVRTQFYRAGVRLAKVLNETLDQ
jgi:transposase